MRPTETFTDGRIHVTLCHGAFDLATLGADDRVRYRQLLDLYVAGSPAPSIEALCIVVVANSQDRETLHALGADLCDRVIVAAHGELPDEELLPWKVEAMRRTVHAARQSLALAS